MKDPSLQSIVADAVSGDSQGLAALHDRYHRMLVRYLRPQASSSAEQLAHHAWLAATAELPSFDGDERAFRRLLLAHADQEIKRHNRSVRSRGSHQQPPVIDLRHSPVSEEPVTDAAIAGLLKGLSPHQIHVILLRVVGGLTAEETADLLHEKASIIRLTEHEALQQVAQRLSDEKSMAGNEP